MLALYLFLPFSWILFPDSYMIGRVSLLQTQISLAHFKSPGKKKSSILHCDFYVIFYSILDVKSSRLTINIFFQKKIIHVYLAIFYFVVYTQKEYLTDCE